MYKYLLGLLLSVFLGTSAIASEEDMSLTQEGCFFVAQALEAGAIGRDLGVSLEQQLKDLEAVKDVHPQLKMLFIKELYNVYNLFKGVPPEKIGGHFYERCFKHRGNLNELTKNGIKI